MISRVGSSSRFEPRLIIPVGPGDHIRGARDAAVTLVEYGDYECPFCGQAHAVVSELLDELGERFRFVFRNFPLVTIHPHAELAAEAAEAAGAQRKFWPMHDTLYENQQALEPEDLLQYAAELDLEVEEFADDLATHRYLNRVRDDFMGGVRSGVSGTPTFFINGVRHDAPWDFETLRSAILDAEEEAPLRQRAS